MITMNWGVLIKNVDNCFLYYLYWRFAMIGKMIEKIPHFIVAVAILCSLSFLSAAVNAAEIPADSLERECLYQVEKEVKFSSAGAKEEITQAEEQKMMAIALVDPQWEFESLILTLLSLEDYQF